MNARTIGSFLLVSAAVGLLAGCSGAAAPAGVAAVAGVPQQSVQVATAQAGIRGTSPSRARIAPFVNVDAVMHPAGDQVIVANVLNNTIDVIGSNGKLQAVVAGFFHKPFGLATDVRGTLYVANAGSQNVVVLPKPYTDLKLVLGLPGQVPFAVAVARDGTVAVTSSLQQNGPGRVSFFAKGSSTPCTIVADPAFPHVLWDGFDASGALYIDGADARGNTVIGKIAGGCGAKAIEPLATNNFLGNAGAIGALRNGDVAIADQSASTIYTYAPPSHGTLGAPIRTFSDPLGDPLTFAIDPRDRSFWLDDATVLEVMKFRYPGGTAPVATVGIPGPTYGMAINPANATAR